jgi:Flp pilus assembly protein TadD
MTAVVVVIAAGTAGFMLRSRFANKRETAHVSVTVLVADFSNHTGDPVFDSALEPIVRMTLDGASFITAYDRTQMRTLGLPAVSGGVDEQAARKIAVGQGLGVVVAGFLDRQGSGYTLSLKAMQAVTGSTIVIAEDKASDKDQIVLITANLAGTIRRALGDATSESALRFANETFTTTSLEAVHEYATAADAMAKGQFEDALRGFSKALTWIPNGIAYTTMAGASRNAGRTQDAEKYIRLALAHLDHMTERERYRTRALYYGLIGDREKCVEEYGALSRRYPSDAVAHSNLAVCLTDLRSLPRALEEVRQAAAILPKRAIYRWNISMYASFGSDFQTGEQEARTLEQMEPSSPLPLGALAFAQVGQGRLDEARNTPSLARPVGGCFDGGSGLANLALYEGHLADGGTMLEQDAVADLAARRLTWPP